MKIKKIGYIVLGCIGVGLGAVGAVLPLLPAFPFLLLAAFCFARSSERLDRWFKGTKLYKENRLCDDARRAGGAHCAVGRVGVPYPVFLLWGQDNPGRWLTRVFQTDNSA